MSETTSEADTQSFQTHYNSDFGNEVHIHQYEFIQKMLKGNSKLIVNKPEKIKEKGVL